MYTLFLLLAGCSGDAPSSNGEVPLPDDSTKSFLSEIEAAGCMTMVPCDYGIMSGISAIGLRSRQEDGTESEWYTVKVGSELFFTDGERLSCDTPDSCKFVLVQGRWPETFFLVYSVERPDEGSLYNLHFNALTIKE